VAEGLVGLELSNAAGEAHMLLSKTRMPFANSGAYPACRRLLEEAAVPAPKVNSALAESLLR
jgi:hypothetical protein